MARGIVPTEPNTFMPAFKNDLFIRDTFLNKCYYNFTRHVEFIIFQYLILTKIIKTAYYFKLTYYFKILRDSNTQFQAKST